MSRVVGRIHGVALGLLFAGATLQFGCGGGGSGDTTAPPPGGPEQVDSLVLSLDSVDVIVGDTTRIRAEARDANGQVVSGIQLTYTSSDPAVATVSNDGLVTAVDLGEAEVEVAIAGAGIRLDSRAAPGLSEALLAGHRSRAKIISVPKVVITPGEQSLDPGATSKYSATITNLSGQGLRNPPVITWSSSNPRVASIDNTGLATAGSAEGDTRILATITIGQTHVRVISIPLHVVVCGGIFRVASWSAIADAEYQAGGTAAISQSTYQVHQISGGSATLARVDLASDADSTVWEGKVTDGNVQLDNKVTFPIGQGKTGITSEVKDGKIQDGPTAYARLLVKHPPAGSRTCTYNFQFSDYFFWELTNNQGAPPTPLAGPTGTALHLGAEVGAPPPAGEPWGLGTLANPVRVQIPGSTLLSPNGRLRSAYSPGTFLGIGIITQLGSPEDPNYGQATFTYFLTAAP